jgi:LmbE family N-acetylglucosaminyl deacetylase
LRDAPPSPGPDSRYKADILVIVAHPDDETEITGYLARAIYDEHKRVAVLFGTRGNAGGNAMGYEQAAALGAEREIEARRALAFMGVMDVWFIGAPDTPSQNVLWSLETWNHGAALEKAVRIVRLTRPEVILTWLPDYVVGENHGDHQASGTIATEAFDTAGDPTKFPEQIAFPRNRNAVGNLTEGLRPWQPEKLYYFSDATQTAFMKGQGPVYSVMDVSPSRHIPYYRLAAQEMAYHLTQGDSGQIAKRAIETGNFKYFEMPVRFIFGKSLVGGSVTGDVFEGVVPGPVSFAPVRGYRPQTHAGISLELGGSWAFYRRFWPAHGIGHLASMMPVPEIGTDAGGEVHIPLLIHNYTSQPANVGLTAGLPSGWSERAGSDRYPVRAHGTYPVQAVLTVPAQASGWQRITWRAESGGQSVGSVRVNIFVRHQGGLPQ